jgi:hypothetical protein
MSTRDEARESPHGGAAASDLWRKARLTSMSGAHRAIELFGYSLLLMAGLCALLMLFAFMAPEGANGLTVFQVMLDRL